MRRAAVISRQERERESTNSREEHRERVEGSEHVTQHSASVRGKVRPRASRRVFGAGSMSLQGHVLDTPSGKLRGRAERSCLGHDYLAFRGVPYAKPPVESLRFKVSPVSLVQLSPLCAATYFLASLHYLYL